jgi:hypothetical protein
MAVASLPSFAGIGKPRQLKRRARLSPGAQANASECKFYELTDSLSGSNAAYCRVDRLYFLNQQDFKHKSTVSINGCNH